MYKNITYLVLTILFFSTTNAYSSTEPGKCEFAQEDANDILCYGPGKLMETMVDGHVAIAGPLEADNTVVIASMNVLGAANLTKSEVQSNVTVAGNLNSIHGQFSGDLNIISDQSTLNHSNVNGSITMKSEKTSPVLKVICGTNISGSITFQEQPGVVQKTKDSQIGGKVVNGKIEIIEAKCE